MHERLVLWNIDGQVDALVLDLADEVDDAAADELVDIPIRHMHRELVGFDAHQV